MTLAEEIASVAYRLASIAPDESRRLMGLAARVRRVELALTELADDARESAELAETAAVVVAFQRRK